MALVAPWRVDPSSPTRDRTASPAWQTDPQPLDLQGSPSNSSNEEHQIHGLQKAHVLFSVLGEKYLLYSSQWGAEITYFSVYQNVSMTPKYTYS